MDFFKVGVGVRRGFQKIDAARQRQLLAAVKSPKIGIFGDLLRFCSGNSIPIFVTISHADKGFLRG